MDQQGVVAFAFRAGAEGNRGASLFCVLRSNEYIGAAQARISMEIYNNSFMHKSDFDCMWRLGRPQVGQNNPTYQTKALPARQTNSETFLGLTAVPQIGPCLRLLEERWPSPSGLEPRGTGARRSSASSGAMNT